MNEIIRNQVTQPTTGDSLDPQDWNDFRALAHRMLDETMDAIANVRERPVWQPIPDGVRGKFKTDVPREATDLGEVYREFSDCIAPYATGNVHPGFMGWVHGGGTAVGMVAEMLAAGLNANLGGRDHMPIEVERQITLWMRELFGFPDSASGVFATGTSMANLMAVLVARTAALGPIARQHGMGADGALLTAYTSSAAHGCISRAMDIAGLGSDALRKIGVDADHRIDVAALRAQIAIDREIGFKPFMIVASAGTVDVGAIDDLAALAALCREEKIWFHVDGAFGALAILSPEMAPRLAGIELADSIALDFHKWGQVPYDAGFLLVRDGEQHRQAFAQPAAYLRRETRGLAAG
jgi:glutamate/tyrosine decarboxylase-like PLP-dependent enzyme